MAKQWSKELKKEIIDESYKYGVRFVCNKYNLSPTTAKRWRNEFKNFGEIGLFWGSGRQALSERRHKRIMNRLQPTFLESEISNMTLSSLQDLARSYLALSEYTSSLEKKLRAKNIKKERL